MKKYFEKRKKITSLENEIDLNELSIKVSKIR